MEHQDHVVTDASQHGSSPRSRLRRVVRTLVLVLDALDRFVWIPVASASLVALAMLVSADAAVRYVLGSSIPYVADLAANLLMPLVVFPALSYAAAVQAHVTIELFNRSMGPLFTRLVRLLSNAIGVAILLLIASEHFPRYLTALGRQTVEFQVPVSYSVGIVVIGTGFGVMRYVAILLAEFGGISEQAELNSGPHDPRLPVE